MSQVRLIKDRLLYFYSLLAEGKVIYKEEEAKHFNCSTRSILRDVEDIRAFLHDQSEKTGYVQDLKLVAKPSTGAYKSVGSFIAIGQVFPSKWDWFQFLNIVALLSIMLAVMNLIPIPGLDGGHILFVLYEMISGRKPSDKFLMVAQMIGMVLLFALMFLAVGNDIGRLLR